MHSPASGPPDMTLRARAVIPDTEGRVLLDRTHDPAKDGFYWFPGGGIEPGETPADAAVREAQEELGVRLATDDQARAMALLHRADARLDETARLLQQGRTDEALVHLEQLLDVEHE